MAKSYSWENPDLDLNLRHYYKNPLDTIKGLQLEISKLLSNSDEQTRRIYSAVYNALDYYRAVSDLPVAEDQTQETFLSHTLNELTSDFRYLSKYNEMYPNDPPVITMSARIKSSLSFVEKAKLKIDEYLQEGRDLTRLNESLRDLIGVRIVINPPESIKKQGKQAESDLLYEIYLDLMRHHGIYNPNQDQLVDGQYRFIDVDTSHNPHKNQDIKNRPKLKGFNPGVLEEIYIPTSRHLEMEHPLVDSKTKDYNMFPKENGYQSLHTCVIPYYSQTIEKFSSSPNTIIDPKPYNCGIEYVFELTDQHNRSTVGLSSRDKYKPYEKVYHRSAVPMIILPDEKGIFRIQNFAVSFEKMYGISFTDYFKIPFETFIKTYQTDVRDKILATHAEVIYDRSTNAYSYRDRPMIAAMPANYVPIFLNQIHEDPDGAIKTLELIGVLDSRYYPDGFSGFKSTPVQPPKIYTVERTPSQQIEKTNQTPVLTDDSSESVSREGIPEDAKDNQVPEI